MSGVPQAVEAPAAKSQRSGARTGHGGVLAKVEELKTTSPASLVTVQVKLEI